MGQLVFQATAGGQVALVGPNPSSGFSLNVPAVNSTLATLAAQTFAGTQTFSVDASISGLTVGKGYGTLAYNTAFGITALGSSSLTGNYNTAVGYLSGSSTTSGAQNTFIGQNSGYLVTTGSKNSVLGAYSGNQGGLDIRTASNYIVLSDGDGNPRGYWNSSGDLYSYGDIYNQAQGYLRLGATSAGTTRTVVIDAGANSFYPSADNSMALGYSTKRWTTVYATTALINTSDATEKQQIADLTTAELATAKAIKGLIKSFKFNDAVKEKGDGARIHIGVIAQDVQKAFTDNGLDPSKYGMFCSDTWYELDGKDQDTEGLWITKDTPNAVAVTRLGIRYEELLAFVISTL